MPRQSDTTRRRVLAGLSLAPALLAARAAGVLAFDQEKQGETEVSTVEDLMREHGVLRRVLLIYQEAVRRLEAKSDVPAPALAGAASLVRRFVEDYHEKLEEQHLFPRFRKAGRLVDLVDVLQQQHDRGRALTRDIEKLAGDGALRNAGDRAKLQEAMRLFVRMYAPHAAREDTVLFPAFKTLVSPNEYDALGDAFEDQEQKMFGKEGFERNVSEVAGLEKQMGLYDLAQFTPKVTA